MLARSSTSPTKVAIACQGGGSQTAFTAGALKALVAGEAPGNYRIVGLSGTSGGAICAALVWCALSLEKDRAAGRRRAARMLDAFWHDNSAKLPSEWLWNRLTVTTRQLQDSGLLPSLSASPYQPAVEGAVHLARLFAPRPEFLDLRRLLETHLPLEQVEQRRAGLQLLVGAVGVRSGAFKAFDSRAGDIDIDAILASASLPWLGRATPIGDEIYWDGLFSQNPPLREFVADLPAADKPNEIWIIRINPQTRASEPKTSEDIHDRRNELAGNLSLNQEIRFIEQVNKWLGEKKLVNENKQTIDILEIAMGEDVSGPLDYASKLDRAPEYIADLMRHGEARAAEALATRSQPSRNTSPTHPPR